MGHAGDGALPAGWASASLGEVAVTQLGKTISPKERDMRPRHPYLRSANVQWGRFDLSDVAEMYFSADELARLAIKPGDLMICEGGEAGRAAIWPDDRSDVYYFQNALHRVRPRDPGIDTRWLYHHLRFLNATGVLTERSRGSTILHLSQAALRELPILLPPVAEQRRIVSRLDAIERRRASASVRLQAARDLVERLRRSVLHAGCTGVLTKDWRDVNPRDRVSAAPPLSAKAATHAGGAPNTDRLSEIPETWAWWPVEGVTDRLIDYRGRTPPVDADGTIPHVRTAQIRNGRIDWNVDTFVTSRVYDAYMTRGVLQRGDVLFTMEAPMGEAGVIDRDERFSVAQRILVMRPCQGMTGEYLALALRSHPVQRALEYRATGSGVRGIASKRLRSVLVPKPPPDEQDEIVRRVGAFLDGADRVARQITHSEEVLDQSSEAALAGAFRGELVPTEAELAAEGSRDFESAEELLERAVSNGSGGSDRSKRSRRG